MAKKQRVTYKQEGGDDGYSYVVRVDGRPLATGLNRSQAIYYADKAKLQHSLELAIQAGSDDS